MKPGKANLIWPALLLLIFARPFLCQMCYPRMDLYYSLVFVIVGLVWIILSASDQRPKTKDQRPTIPILLFSLALISSTLFSKNTVFSLAEVYKFIPYLAAFYLISKISFQQRKQLLLTLIAAGFLLSLYAIYQFFWGLDCYLTQAADDLFIQDFLARKRAFATFFSPDMFAGYLIIIIPLTLGLFLDSLIKKNRLLYLFTGAGLFFMLVALALTKSLGAGLSLLLALLAFAVLLFVLRPDLRPKLLPVSIIAGSLIILILAITLTSRLEYLGDRTSPHNSLVQRLYFWQAAVRMIKDFPLTGIGLGNFGLLYAHYKAPQAIETNFAHNSYLQLWVETGILGVISIFWLVISAFRAGLKNLQGNTEQIMTVGLLCANFAFLVHNLVDFSFFVPEVALIWWVVLGCAFLKRSCPGPG